MWAGGQEQWKWKGASLQVRGWAGAVVAGLEPVVGLGSVGKSSSDGWAGEGRSSSGSGWVGAAAVRLEPMVKLGPVGGNSGSGTA